MVRGGSRGGGSAAEDPLGDLLDNMKQNAFPGLFLSSRSAPDYIVVLDDWWLVRVDGGGESKKLAISGYMAKKNSDIPYISTPIVKRHDSFTLEATDGMIVKVVGKINFTNTQNNGFSREVCQHFNLGFPFSWKQYINSRADSTLSLGTSTFKIFEHFLSGNPSAINDENLEDPIGGMAEEYETRSNENLSDKEPSMEYATPPQSENNLSETELDIADIEQHEGSAFLEKDDALINSKLPTRKRKVPVSKLTSRKKSSKKDTAVPDVTPASRKGSKKKGNTLQTTPKTKAHRAEIVISPLSSDNSNVRRSRSGRVLISAVDKGSQKVLYDKNGNFLGVKTVS